MKNPTIWIIFAVVGLIASALSAVSAMDMYHQAARGSSDQATVGNIFVGVAVVFGFLTVSAIARFVKLRKPASVA